MPKGHSDAQLYHGLSLTVGYAWLPLIDSNGRLVPAPLLSSPSINESPALSLRLLEDSHLLHVAANLPPNYLLYTTPAKVMHIHVHVVQLSERL